jgi:hypothetical protein
MTAEKLNRWLTLGANLGVVVGLVLLIIEIRQNTAMMEAQMMQSRTDAAMVEQEAVYNSDYIPRMRVKIEKGEVLSKEETFRYEPWFRSFNRNMDNQLWQYRHGFLGENIPVSIERAVRVIIGGSEVGRAEWERQRTTYTSEYVDFVDEVLASIDTREP